MTSSLHRLKRAATAPNRHPCQLYMYSTKKQCSRQAKKTPPLPAVFPSVPKGRKGEKEIGHSKLMFWGPESRGERM